MRDIMQKMSKTDQKARLPREWLGKEESPGIRRLVSINNISRENRKITRKETDLVLLLFYFSCLICYNFFLSSVVLHGSPFMHLKTGHLVTFISSPAPVISCLYLLGHFCFDSKLNSEPDVADYVPFFFFIALHDSLRPLVISLTFLYPVAKCRSVCWNHHVLVSICPALLRKYLLNCSPSATKLVSEHA